MKRLFLLLALALVPSLVQSGEVKPVHGIAMHGSPKYGPDFKHFDYVNPQAPKGGEVRMAQIGTFDSLNPFIVKGIPPTDIGLLFSTLLAASADEPFSEYGYVAESVEMPDDRSWVIFNLRPSAKFHDGKPVTAEDVVFSFTTLKTKGAPFYRLYYAGVAKAEALESRKVKFSFAGEANRELPLIVGQMPILSKASWAKRNFEETTQEPPVGSGPYRVESVEPGRGITYRRDPDFWAKDLAVMKGRHNFDRIRIDVYRDATVALEALKAGEYDFRQENESKKWATEYKDAPGVKSGLMKAETIANQRPVGMQGFVMNQRRSLFQDRRVRQAMGLAFDFEWSNKNLFYGQYTRTQSYFANSDLAASGLPSPAELKLLEPFKDKLPPEVFFQAFKAPATNGDGNPRENLRAALVLLKEAGWEVKERRLVNEKTGAPFSFEILLGSPAFERIALPYVENLKKLGIEASVRTLDTAQYKSRTDAFEFDMTVDLWGASESPGNELREFFGSQAAAMRGSRNSIGLKDPVADHLIDLVIAAPDREALVSRVRALDRVLVWGHYVVPHWHIAYDRVAYWDKFGRPAITPRQGFQFDSWWIDAAKAEALSKSKANAGR
ncbi:MAG: ABC transporter substrate-binding protein [Alphaproteobacteria bacterium]|nr:ABC transporter substrate-binding protein [Alphaproteobacteria bacterium]